MVADPFAWIGHTLDGRYRAIAVAGEGGFGVVYRGHHLALDVPVAIKCLKVSQSLGREERDAFELRFTEEGRVLHRLRQEPRMQRDGRMRPEKRQVLARADHRLHQVPGVQGAGDVYGARQCLLGHDRRRLPSFEDLHAVRQLPQ